jgi:hypothetical protein
VAVAFRSLAWTLMVLRENKRHRVQTHPASPNSLFVLRMLDETSDVVATCFMMVLSDEPWRDIGFSKRPRCGAFFQRFRAAWKTDLEKRTIQEMLAAFTAAHAVAGRVSPDGIRSIIAAYTARPDVLTALGYSSREEGVRHLTETTADYCRTPIRDWASIAVKGIEPSSIPDKALSARLLVGCIQFSQNLGNMVLVLRRHPASPNGT